MGPIGFDFGSPSLEFLAQYLLFKGLPLFLGEDAGVVLFSYFYSLIGYLDYRALPASATQLYNFHALLLLSFKI